MKQNKLKIKTQFREAKSYIKKSAGFIYLAIAVFVIGAFLGFLFKENLSFIEQFLRELMLKTEGLNTPEMIFFILQNNLQSSFLSIIFGLLIGAFPFFSAISNGVIIGYVLARVYEITGSSSWWRLLPHGIFELPAIFISFGLGIKLGFGFIKNYFQYYAKKTKILAWLPLLLAIFSTALNIIFRNDLEQQLPITIPAPALFSLGFVSNLIFYLFILIVLTFAFNKKLRKIQKAHLKDNFYNAINVFLMIIIPLLIIAAIIEGLLIGFLG